MLQALPLCSGENNKVLNFLQVKRILAYALRRRATRRGLVDNENNGKTIRARRVTRGRE